MDIDQNSSEIEIENTQSNNLELNDLYACKKLKCKSPISSPGSNLRMNSSDWGSGKSSINSKMTLQLIN